MADHEATFEESFTISEEQNYNFSNCKTIVLGNNITVNDNFNIENLFTGFIRNTWDQNPDIPPSYKVHFNSYFTISKSYALKFSVIEKIISNNIDTVNAIRRFSDNILSSGYTNRLTTNQHDYVDIMLISIYVQKIKDNEAQFMSSEMTNILNHIENKIKTNRQYFKNYGIDSMFLINDSYSLPLKGTFSGKSTLNNKKNVYYGQILIGFHYSKYDKLNPHVLVPVPDLEIDTTTKFGNLLMDYLKLNWSNDHVNTDYFLAYTKNEINFEQFHNNGNCFVFLTKEETIKQESLDVSGSLNHKTVQVTLNLIMKDLKNNNDNDEKMFQTELYFEKLLRTCNDLFETNNVENCFFVNVKRNVVIDPRDPLAWAKDTNVYSYTLNFESYFDI